MPIKFGKETNRPVSLISLYYPTPCVLDINKKHGFKTAVCGIQIALRTYALLNLIMNKILFTIFQTENYICM